MENLTRFLGGVEDGGGGEAERRVSEGGEGGLQLGVEGTRRLAPPSLALTPLACIALSATTPFLRLMCRLDRRSFLPVEFSVSQ